jgi:hypothetical protein
MLERSAAIHQETKFPIAPERVYELLTDGAQFAAAARHRAQDETEKFVALAA